MNDWQRWYSFNVENWYPYVKHLCAKTKFIPLSIQDAILLLKGGSYSLQKRVNACIHHRPVFFKLSTRSGKDAWQVLDPSLGIVEEDDIDTRRDKLQKQLELLKVTSFDDIVRVVKASERLQDDLQQYIEHTTPNQTMSIVLQSWRPSQGVEYRCFVKNKRMIACCQYNTWLSTNHVIPKEAIETLVTEVASLLPMTDFVLDVFVTDKTEAHFIELNPFDEGTDPIEFSWEELNHL